MGSVGAKAPKEKAKAAAKSNRNKRAAESEAGPSANKGIRVGGGLGGPVDMTQEDAEAADKFKDAIAKFYDLNASSADDDAAFGRWAKDTIQATQDLRTQINNRKKSLKRRATNKDSSLGPALDEFSVELTSLMDFIRKLANGNPEGSQLYSVLQNMPHIEVCKTIWKRVVRASAFEYLKLAQWDDFFKDANTMCLKHLPDEADSFLQLLASQPLD